MGFILLILGVLLIVGAVIAFFAFLMAATFVVMVIAFIALVLYFAWLLGNPYLGALAAIGTILIVIAINSFIESETYRRWTKKQ